MAARWDAAERGGAAGRRVRTDGFVAGMRDGLHEVVVMGNADRVVELCFALVEHLPPVVTVELADWRCGASWRGEGLATAEALAALARLKVGLVRHAGVELTLLGADDQVTMTPNLEVVAYGRSDRWRYLLLGKGLRLRRVLRPRSWRLGRGEFGAAPAFEAEVARAAGRLGLSRAGAGSP